MGGGAPETLNLEKGSIVAGRYRIESVLGVGGTAAVYAVTDLASGQVIALKRIAAGADPRVTRLFELEYRTLASLRHPGIVAVYDYGKDLAGARFYTMEVVDGRPLSEQPVPLPWREACVLLRDAASIVAILHARGLVHRDLSAKNLLRRADGRLKLIDFGALAELGTQTTVVGTPPFVAPEALATGHLDHRADLFALGALGYWLLTGVNAFPARELRELPALWQREPARPSSLLRRTRGPDREPIPAELDRLLGALLRIEPEHRLDSTAELVGRLDAVAGLAPESLADIAHGYLESNVLVGRSGPEERMRVLLRAAASGHGGALLIEAAAGVGRTRLLHELAVLARLDGALAVSVAARPGALAHTTATTLLQSMRALAPDLADPAAMPVAPPAPDASRLHDGRQERVVLQAALSEFFRSIARTRTLVLLVDDLHLADEASQALLAGLSRECEHTGLVIVASARSDLPAAPSPSFARFRAAAIRIQLEPLSEPETLALLRSVFGGVPYLERLATRIHRVAQGNPSYTLELAAHLVRTEVARYAQGTWVLPPELPPGELPASRNAAHVAQLDELSTASRVLARHLSVSHHGVLSMAACGAAAEQGEQETRILLDELHARGVLGRADHGYYFVHDELRATLCGELAASERSAIHLRIARAIVAETGEDPHARLLACIHFLRGNDPAQALVLLKRVALFFARGDVAELGVCAPRIEEILGLLLERRMPRILVAVPLSLLSIAGYFVDRRYARRYGDEAITLLSDLLRLRLAKRARWLLGRRLALLLALMIATVPLLVGRDRKPSIVQLVTLMLMTSSALSAHGVITFNLEAVDRYARLVQPLTALGAHHAASVLYDFIRAVEHCILDAPSAGFDALTRMLARLEHGPPIRQLDDGLKTNFIAGCHLALGVAECWRDDDAALQRAARLEAFGPLYAMGADQLRASYHASHGAVPRSEHYRKRMEVHAVQLGSAWQVETWAPINTMTVAPRLHDALAVRRSAHELERLKAEIPTLEQTYREACGTYALLRGQFEEAASWLAVDRWPRERIGWTRTCGLLAQALNGLARHAEARALCVEAIARLEPEDLAYTSMNLTVQRELALAEAGLGNHGEAARQLDALIERHAPNQNPLTLGMLHDARSRVALAAGDRAGARMHFLKMEAWYGSTAIPTVREHLDAMRERIEGERSLPPASRPASMGDDASHLLTRIQVALAGEATRNEDRPDRALAAALELCAADAGFIVVPSARDDRVAAHRGGVPEPALVAWALEELRAADAEADTVVAHRRETPPRGHLTVGDLAYRFVPLFGIGARETRLTGGLVLGFRNRAASALAPDVLRMLGQSLHPRV